MAPFLAALDDDKADSCATMGHIHDVTDAGVDMEHQIGNQPVSADYAGDKAAFVENELRRLCSLLGFTMEPIESRNETDIAQAGSAPRSFSPALHGQLSPVMQHRRARARLVRSEIKKRRQRDRFFPPDLFADPAWDILLDLYAADYEERHISVSSACIAAAVPATTALRWLKTLADSGQIVRVPDQADGRRIFVAISDASRLQLDAYFDELEDS
ncbi:hypothetical protein [Sphingopyxis sp. PAMC25046]|uniref:hypothetical protein n=1 Tax=Sphingopyxis sp. PAMC25046 TaxID=2565556 RepID=UPI001446F367|nr:hypothetical protein [Sphingopyxis sp. PAMC25046]